MIVRIYKMRGGWPPNRPWTAYCRQCIWFSSAVRQADVIGVASQHARTHLEVDP